MLVAGGICSNEVGMVLIMVPAIAVVINMIASLVMATDGRVAAAMAIVATLIRMFVNFATAVAMAGFR